MIKFFTITAAAASMMALNANAGETPSTISGWVKQASSAIEAKMEYPETAAIIGDIGTNTFAVTVNRQGDVLNVTKQSRAKQSYFDNASYDALQYVDLPDLPASYKKDKLTFVLVLDYIQHEEDIARLHNSDDQRTATMYANSNKKTHAEEKSTDDTF